MYTLDNNIIKPLSRPQSDSMEFQAVEAVASEVLIILHTVNEYETQAVLSEMEAPLLPQRGEKMNGPVNLLVESNKIILGMFGGYPCALVQTEQGSRCKKEIEYALQHLPSCQVVILVGVAYGREKYKFGDVLVSKAICGVVNPKFKGEKIIPRSAGSSCVPTSDKLSIFTRNLHAWNGFTCVQSGRKSAVYAGDIVSVAWLISSSEIRDGLLNNFPDAVGGEMEGLTLLEIQKEYELTFEVIIIKAVADYADEKKQEGKKWQYTAAKAAANYTKFKLEMTNGELFSHSTNPPTKRIKKEKEE